MTYRPAFKNWLLSLAFACVASSSLYSLTLKADMLEGVENTNLVVVYGESNTSSTRCKGSRCRVSRFSFYKKAGQKIQPYTRHIKSRRVAVMHTGVRILKQASYA